MLFRSSHWPKRLQSVMDWADELETSEEITLRMQVKYTQTMEEIHKIHLFLEGLELLLHSEKFGSLRHTEVTVGRSKEIPREETRAVLEDFIGIAEEYAILYEDGLNVPPEERKKNTRASEVEALLCRARRLLHESGERITEEH